MPDPRTIRIYDTHAVDYAAMTEKEGRSRWFDAFVDALPAGAHVLDLGCGPGTYAARMVARGLTVDALDASPGMIDTARQRYGIEARLGTFDDVTGTALYDGVWAHFSLLHAPREDLPRHLSALAQALKPGGRLMLAMKLGQGVGRDTLERQYTYYSEDALTAALEAAGFEVLARDHRRFPGFDGTVDDCLMLQAATSR